MHAAGEAGAGLRRRAEPRAAEAPGLREGLTESVDSAAGADLEGDGDAEGEASLPG